MDFSVSKDCTKGEYVVTTTWYDKTIKTKEVLRSQDEVEILPIHRGFFRKNSFDGLLTLYMPIYHQPGECFEPEVVKVMNNIQSYEIKDSFILIEKKLSSKKTCYYCFSLDPFNTITTIWSGKEYQAIVEERVKNMPKITRSDVTFNQNFHREGICVLKSKRTNIFVKNASTKFGTFGVKHYYFAGIVKPLSENYFTFEDKEGVRVSDYFFNIDGTKTKYSLKELGLDVFAEVININEIFDKKSDRLPHLGGEGWYAVDKNDHMVEIRHRNIHKTVLDNLYSEFVYKATEPLKEFQLIVHQTSKKDVYSYELRCMPEGNNNFRYIICDIEGTRFRIEL